MPDLQPELQPCVDCGHALEGPKVEHGVRCFDCYQEHENNPDNGNSYKAVYRPTRHRAKPACQYCQHRDRTNRRIADGWCNCHCHEDECNETRETYIEPKLQDKLAIGQQNKLADGQSAVSVYCMACEFSATGTASITTSGEDHVKRKCPICQTKGKTLAVTVKVLP